MTFAFGALFVACAASKPADVVEPEEGRDPLIGTLVVRGVVASVNYVGESRTLTTITDVDVLAGRHASSTLTVNTQAEPDLWGVPSTISFRPARVGEEIVLTCQPPMVSEEKKGPGRGECDQQVVHGDFFRQVTLPDGASIAVDGSYRPVSAVPPEGVTDFSVARLWAGDDVACGGPFRGCSFHESNASVWDCAPCRTQAATWDSFVVAFARLARDPSTRGDPSAFQGLVPAGSF